MVGRTRSCSAVAELFGGQRTILERGEIGAGSEGELTRSFGVRWSGLRICRCFVHEVVLLVVFPSPGLHSDLAIAVCLRILRVEHAAAAPARPGRWRG